MSLYCKSLFKRIKNYKILPYRRILVQDLSFSTISCSLNNLLNHLKQVETPPSQQKKNNMQHVNEEAPEEISEMRFTRCFVVVNTLLSETRIFWFGSNFCALLKERPTSDGTDLQCKYTVARQLRCKVRYSNIQKWYHKTEEKFRPYQPSF